MSSQRTDLVFRIQVAEKSERYDDMVELVTNLVQGPALSDKEILNLEERNLFSVAFNNALGQRRLSWRLIKQIEEKQVKRQRMPAITATALYREKVENEIASLCRNALQMLEGRLLKSSKEPAAIVFYHKLAADYSRYIAEYSTGDTKSEAVNQASKYYKEAVGEGKNNLRPVHPLMLGLMLNFAVFTYEVLGKSDEAISMAEDAYKVGSKATESADAKDSTLVVQLLKSNLRVWKEAGHSAVSVQA